MLNLADSISSGKQTYLFNHGEKVKQSCICAKWLGADDFFKSVAQISLGMILLKYISSHFTVPIQYIFILYKTLDVSKF